MVTCRPIICITPLNLSRTFLVIIELYIQFQFYLMPFITAAALPRMAHTEQMVSNVQFRDDNITRYLLILIYP